MSKSSKKQLLQRFLNWAESQTDIRAVAMIGSAARLDHPADEWSDYDLIIVASDPQSYLASTDWLETIGRPWCSILERLPTGNPIERRVLFEGGFDMDFIILSVENAQRDFQNTPMVREICQRGMRVLWDRDSLLSTLSVPPIAVHEGQPPSIQAFLAVANDFWFHAAWTAKKLCRGELWIAKRCCDTYLKDLLLRMMEWEAKAAHGWGIDIWFGGHFLEEWALPETLEELRQVFAYYDAKDVWRALEATMMLFRRITRETAKRLAYDYPIDGDEQVSAWIAQIHTENSAGS